MVLVLFLAAVVTGASSPQQGVAFHIKKAPSGAILVEHFWLEDMPRTLIGRQQIWLRAADGQSQPTLLFEHQRIAEVLFSPDERWIAINDAPLSDLADVRLYRRASDLKSREVERAQPGKSCLALLDHTSGRKVSAILDHTYVNAVRWSPDSRALLLVVRGHRGNDISVGDWLCVFDLERLRASTDLRLMNRGAIHDPRRP